MLDGQGYDISCDLVMKVSVGKERGYVSKSTCHVHSLTYISLLPNTLTFITK